MTALNGVQNMARILFITAWIMIGAVLVVIASGTTDPQPVGRPVPHGGGLPVTLNAPGTLEVTLSPAEADPAALYGLRWEGGAVRLNANGYLMVEVGGAVVRPLTPYPHIQPGGNRLWVTLDGGMVTILLNEEFVLAEGFTAGTVQVEAFGAVVEGFRLWGVP